MIDKGNIMENLSELKIRLPITKWEDICISKEKRIEITAQTLRDFFRLDKDIHIENGDIIHYEEYYTSHSWSEKKVLRKATNEEEIIYNLILKLEKSK